MNAVEIPVFPAGVLKIYNNPKPPVIPSMEEFEFNQQVISNPDTTQFLEASNIIDHDGLADLKVWLEECVKDYLDNVMTLDYREFWIHESWLNKAAPGQWREWKNPDAGTGGSSTIKSEGLNPKGEQCKTTADEIFTPEGKEKSTTVACKNLKTGEWYLADAGDQQKRGAWQPSVN